MDHISDFLQFLAGLFEWRSQRKKYGKKTK